MNIFPGPNFVSSQGEVWRDTSRLASSETQGRSVGSGKTASKVFKKAGESPWDATLNDPVPQLIRMLVPFWHLHKSKHIVTQCKGIRILESGKFVLVVESGKRLLMESAILHYGILNQLNESGIPLNPESKFHWQTRESSTLKSGIHSVECRIQDCPGFLYMGRISTSHTVFWVGMSYCRHCPHASDQKFLNWSLRYQLK